MGLAQNIKDQDFVSIRQAISKLGSIKLGPTSSPKFAGLTLTDLTASRLIASDSSKNLVSTDINSWITGTTNQITVTDDSDGTVTLSTPQDLDTGCDFVCGSLTVDTDTLTVSSANHNVCINATSYANRDFIFQASADGSPAAVFRNLAGTSEGVTIGFDASGHSYITAKNASNVTGIGIYSGDNNALLIREQAAAGTDTAAYMQVWVRNDTPNILCTTDDAGRDYRLCPYWFDVTMYGATGDGVTDDTTAIAAAVTAAGAGDTVYFPAGTYLTTDDIEPSADGQKYIGDGIDITTIKYSGSGSGTVINSYTTGAGLDWCNQLVADMTIDCNGAAESVRTAVKLRGNDNNRIERIRVKNAASTVSEQFIVHITHTSGESAVDCHDNAIRDCIVEDCYGNYCTDIAINGSATQSSYFSKNAVMERNVISDGNIAFNYWQVDGLVIRDNVATGIPFGIFADTGINKNIYVANNNIVLGSSGGWVYYFEGNHSNLTFIGNYSDSVYANTGTFYFRANCSDVVLVNNICDGVVNNSFSINADAANVTGFTLLGNKFNSGFGLAAANEYTILDSSTDIVAGSKTLTVEDDSVVNQDLSSDADVTFNDITVSTPSNIYALSHDSFADVHQDVNTTASPTFNGLTVADASYDIDWSGTNAFTIFIGHDAASSSYRKCIDFGQGGWGNPGGFNTSSDGDKLVLQDNSGTDADFRLGVGLTYSTYLKVLSNSDANGQFNIFTGTDVTTPRFCVHTAASKSRCGIMTSAPDKALEINDAAGDCLRLTYGDINGSAANYSDLLVSSAGTLTINSSSGYTIITDSVGINTSANPVSALDIKSGSITIQNSTHTSGDFTEAQTVTWTGESSSNSIAEVVAIREGWAGAPTSLVFKTRLNDAPAYALERVRISSSGGLFLTELSAADTDIAGKGQLWVKNNTPNELWFTDDAGSDFQLSNLTYTEISGNDSNTDVTGAELETLTDGSATYLHGHVIERGDPASWDWSETGSKAVLNTDGNWHDLDCSSIVPAGATWIVFTVAIKDDLTGQSFWMRKNGNSNSIAAAKASTLVANVPIFTPPWFVPCDSSRVVEYLGSNTAWTNIDVVVMGWVLG